MDLIELGQRIKCLRDKFRMTQSQLANSLHISPQAVSKWERGENAPDIVMLIPLANLFQVSVEWILTGSKALKDTFEATVLHTSIRDYAHRAANLSPKNTAVWINTLFYGITETVQGFGGVTTQYAGDNYLAYFSGELHASRAFEAAIRVCQIIQKEQLLATLNTGEVYLGTLGHPDHARLEILGETVNIVFLMNRWATQASDANLLLSGATWQQVESPFESKVDEVQLTGSKNPIALHSLSI